MLDAQGASVVDPLANSGAVEDIRARLAILEAKAKK